MRWFLVSALLLAGCEDDPCKEQGLTLVPDIARTLTCTHPQHRIEVIETDVQVDKTKTRILVCRCPPHQPKEKP